MERRSFDPTSPIRGHGTTVGRETLLGVLLDSLLAGS